MKTIKIKYTDNIQNVSISFIGVMLEHAGNLPQDWSVTHEDVTYGVTNPDKGLPVVTVTGGEVDHDALIMIMNYTGKLKLVVRHDGDEYQVKYVRFGALKKLALIGLIGGVGVGGYLWFKGRVAA